MNCDGLSELGNHIPSDLKLTYHYMKYKPKPKPKPKPICHDLSEAGVKGRFCES